MKLPNPFARKQTHSVERLDALADKGVRMSGGKEKTSVSTSHVVTPNEEINNDGSISTTLLNNTTQQSKYQRLVKQLAKTFYSALPPFVFQELSHDSFLNDSDLIDPYNLRSVKNNSLQK